jgi:hypothetical protein
MARLPHVPSKTGDILYETFYSGAIGGSLLALLFLLSDAVHGHALFTPSVLGSTLLLGAPLRATQSPGLESVAWFSVVHFALFGALGLIGSLLVRSMEARENRPTWVTLALFGIMEAGFFLPLRALVPGLPALLGYARVSGINLLTAAVMVLFLHHARRVDAEAEAEVRARARDADRAMAEGSGPDPVEVPSFVGKR